MKSKVVSQLLDKEALEKTIDRLSDEILKGRTDLSTLAVIGMRTRGVHIARRIADIVKAKNGVTVPFGVLDVTFYRDDFRIRFKQPNVQITDIPFSLDNKDVLLVDDVLYTGRTIRSALNAIMDYGRPARIEFAVLVDRGHRELPIQANFTGEVYETQLSEEIQVRIEELDGEDGVYIVKAPTQ